MICPKCGFSQPDDIYCALCGVGIEKYLRQRRKRQYKVWILIALIGIAGLSIVQYINSIRRVESPEPGGRYGHKESKTRRKDITLPGKSPSQFLPGEKPYSRRETDHLRRTQLQEESLRPDRPRDKRLSGDESSGRISSEQQKGELSRDQQGATDTAREWFEKGRVMDDESEAEIQCYQKAIELDPEFAAAYYCVGAIHFRQANYELAYQEFAKFLKYASEADRQAYNIYVYCSPSDVERLSEEKIKGEGPAEGAKGEIPPEGEEEILPKGEQEILPEGEEEILPEGEKEMPSEGEKEASEPTGDETGQEASEGVMTVVRFLPVDGHIMVPVVLNGFLEARVLVDTGAGITVLSRELAQKLQLEGQLGHSITLKTMSMDIQAQLATLNSIQVGNLIQHNLRVAITDLPPGEERKFDGIMGMDFMNKYKIQIDNENKRILLSPGKTTW